MSAIVSPKGEDNTNFVNAYRLEKLIQKQLKIIDVMHIK